MLFVILILVSVREPRRVTSDPSEGGAVATVRDFVAHLRTRRSFYVPFYVGSGVSTLFPLAVMSWSPSLLVRQHGFGQTQAGYQVGTVGVIFSLAGTVAWPLLARALERHFVGRGAILALVCAAAVGLLAIAAPASDSAWVVIAGAGLTMGCLGAWSVLPALIVQRFGPSRMRARMIALHLFFISTVGYAFGPLLAVRLGSLWAGPGTVGAGGLGMGLASLGAATLPVALVCYILTARAAGALAERDDTALGHRNAEAGPGAAPAVADR